MCSPYCLGFYCTRYVVVLSIIYLNLKIPLYSHTPRHIPSGRSLLERTFPKYQPLALDYDQLITLSLRVSSV